MDKKETTQLKGIDLALLYWHHLFGCGNFSMLEENTWIPCFRQYDSILGGVHRSAKESWGKIPRMLASGWFIIYRRS